MTENINTAVVTGGSRGIGKCISMALAREGYQVYLSYVSKQAEAEKVVQDIQSFGGKAKAFALDVSDAQAVSSFFLHEVKDKVQLSVLVNNAGIVRDGFLIRMKDEDFEKVIATNLNGAFYCLREAAKVMSKQRFGSIINISSIVGQMGNAFQVNYAAAKAGLIGLTKSAAKELAARNITVNAIAPGFIETDMTDALSEEIQKSYMDQIPLKRFGTAQEIADAVNFLSSSKARYITGQVLGINGGMYC